MPTRTLALAAVAAIAAIAATACSKGQEAAPAAPAPAQQPRGPSAAKQFEMYQQMVDAGSAELAVPLGDDILRTFPDSPEAAKVKETLEPLRAKATADGESRRLGRLWAYQTGPMAGGRQSTASVYSKDGAATGTGPRLILRKHSEWGQSVYVFGEEPGFSCAKPCRVSVRFDGEAAKSFEGSIPPTGEPAIFIEDDKPFLVRMGKAREIAIEVTPKGGAKRTLVYEVGGFDTQKWVPVPAK